MSFTSAPPPVKDFIVDLQRRLTPAWERWFTQFVADQDDKPSREKTVSLDAKSASIATTSIPLGALSAGLYRVTVYARITTAATTSSSLQVTVSWTDSGVSCSKSNVAMTGNTTATSDSFSVLVDIDQGTAVSYSTTYASVGGTAMQYKLRVVAERVDA